MDRIKRALLYSRVSSDRQETDLSISAQLKALREYARRNNLEIVKEFIDEAESGTTAARPAFREMISLARRKDHPCDLIVVWKYSRFARSRQDSILFKAMLAKNNVRVISINEPFEDNPTGKLLEAMIESLDEFYSANLGEEVTRGLRESASRGFYVGSHIPYGYKRIKVKDGLKERPKLELEPQQAEIVALLFQRVIEGHGLKDLVKELNRQGLPSPKGMQWAKTTIRVILANEVYTGTLVWGRRSKRELVPIRIENAVPAIIDRPTFIKVQQTLMSRARANIHPRRVTSHYLLSGLVKCGYCGKALSGQDAKSGKFAYYVCTSLMKKGAGTCQCRYLNKDKFEGTVIKQIQEHILTEDNLKTLVKLINEETDLMASDISDQLKRINQELEEASSRLSKLYEALETGRLSLEDLAPRIKDLRAREERLLQSQREQGQLLSDRKVELADLETVNRYVADLSSLLREGDFTERKAFIRSFIKGIKVTKDKVTLSYTIPVLPQGGTEEELPVLSIEHNGGR